MMIILTGCPVPPSQLYHQVMLIEGVFLWLF